MSYLTQKDLTQSLKNEIEIRKEHLLFCKLKNVDSFKTYKSLKLNVEKAYKFS